MLRPKTPKLSPNFTPKLSSSSSSAEIIACNDDLLTLILLRLPIKSLLYFKSVSKHWLSLISDPLFSHHRTISQPTTPSGIFLHRLCPVNPKFVFVNLTSEPSRPPFESISFVKQRFGIEILQSCNGLLLCGSYRLGLPRRNYYIYNPTTKQYTVLPKLQIDDWFNNSIFGLTLAFEPSKSPHYKVVCVRNHDSSWNSYQIELYTSQNGPWRPSGLSFAPTFPVQFNSGVYWNGAIHWVSDWGNSLYFDVDEEVLHEIPMPEIPDGWDERIVGYFGESGGHLHLIQIDTGLSTLLNIYEMEEDHSGWSVKHKVDLHHISTIWPEMIRNDLLLQPWNIHYYEFSILCMVGDEIDENCYMVLHITGKIIRYNLKFQTSELLCDTVMGFGVDGDFSSGLRFTWTDAFLYTESLACV